MTISASLNRSSNERQQELVWRQQELVWLIAMTQSARVFFTAAPHAAHISTSVC